MIASVGIVPSFLAGPFWLALLAAAGDRDIPQAKVIGAHA